jgi:hypothetical protein
VDHGDGITLLPVGGRVPSGQCGSCGAGRTDADRSVECAADYFDDDVVVIRAPERNGFVVVPRLHVEGLEDLSISCRASVLAAVRRAAGSVRGENPWSAVRIEVLTDLSTSEGHMSIQVLPGDPDGAWGSSPSST